MFNDKISNRIGMVVFFDNEICEKMLVLTIYILAS